MDNRLTIFTPRILLVHDDNGQLRLSHEELAAYDEAKRRISDRANEAFGYRGKMIESGEAPFKCRSSSRYLYADEFGSVHWCYQTRESFSKDLLAYTYADLREQFDTPKSCNTHCTIGCARTASATDRWRSQRRLTDAALAATA